jgi:uncharacterized protein (DUF433 family)
MRRAVGAFEGCYEADRAAALAGVPPSTLYEWARTGVVVPSVSSTRPMYWSYADLMALRIVHWLRHPKRASGPAVPATPMRAVRRALGELDRLGLDLWSPRPHDRTSPLEVDRSGHIYIRRDDSLQADRGQGVLPDTLDLLGPVDGDADTWGPDLRQPAPQVRIVPGKLSGEPHLAASRLTTRAVAALAGRGFALADIRRLYPDEDPEGLREAIELEQRLTGH